MTTEELQKALELSQIHRSCWSFGEIAQSSESYSLIQIETGWAVYYKERGQVTELKQFQTESDACNFMKSLFEQAFGIDIWEKPGPLA